MSERKGNDTRKISRANGKRLVRPNRRAGHREMTYSQLWTFATVATENPIRAGADTAMGYLRAGMIDLLKLLGGFLVGLFRSQAAREAEMAFLRQQLLVLKRSAPARLRLRNADRLIVVWLYRLFPSLLGAAVIFQPETLVRWHRSGFRLYLALEVSPSCRPTCGACRDPRADPNIKPRQPALGRTTHSRRAAETWDRHCTVDGRQVYIPAAPSAFSGLAGLSAQSHRPHRCR